MQTNHTPRTGAIEAGGTKCICAVGRHPDELLLPQSRLELPSSEGPQEVIARIVDWFAARHAEEPLHAIGIAAFGPLDLDPQSPAYGFITATPKALWRDTDWLGPFRQAFPDMPLAIDTDVNGAALGEWRWGAARGLADFIYITMGTGIGGGAMVGGQLCHGLLHPEMGHMRIARIAGDDFAGICPFHNDCWEGLCSGPALLARTGMPAERLPADHIAWEYLVRYTAAALANLVCVLSPQRIILGGSVRKAGALGEEAFFARLGEALKTSLNGYIALPAIVDEIDRYIVPPMLRDAAGACGAMALAQAALSAQVVSPP